WRPLRRRCAELGERLLVEREDEVRLRLHAAVEVVGQRALVEGHPGAQEVLLQHRLRRDLRVTRDELLEQLGARAECGAHAWNLPPPAGSRSLYEILIAGRWTSSEAVATLAAGHAPPSPHRSPLGSLRHRPHGPGACGRAGADAERELPAHGPVHRARARR